MDSYSRFVLIWACPFLPTHPPFTQGRTIRYYASLRCGVAAPIAHAGYKRRPHRSSRPVRSVAHGNQPGFPAAINKAVIITKLQVDFLFLPDGNERSQTGVL